MRTVLKVFGSMLLANLAASLVGLVYSILALLPGHDPVDASRFWVWAGLAAAVSYPLGSIPLLTMLAPVGRALDALAARRAIDAQELTRARRRALNLPVLLAGFTLANWLVIAASIPLVFTPAPGVELDVGLTVRGLLATSTIGFMASGLTFSIVDWWVRSQVVGALFPDGKVAGTLGVRQLSLRTRMLVVLVDAGLIPVVSLVAQAWVGDSFAAMALVGGSFFVLGLFELGFVSRSFTEPVIDVARAMEQVARGRHDVRVAVPSADDVGRLAEGFNHMVEGIERAEFVKDTFGRYVTHQVLDEILSGKVALGGERRVATVLFSDIRGFTALSERLDPGQVVEFLNEYLTLMVDVLVDHGGTIDKFIGDAIMASFGVPVSKEDDARRAVNAGLAMLHRLDQWNRERQARGQLPVDVGIGLHTGEVVAGNIGSQKKLEYTVIGDTVNTSSRIEQLNKQLGTRLLISAETHALVASLVQARRCEPVVVKGKSAPLVVYEVLGAA